MSNPNIGKLSKQANEARNKKLTKEQRKEIASIAAKARWKKYGEQHCAKCNVYRSVHGSANHKFVENIKNNKKELK